MGVVTAPPTTPVPTVGLQGEHGLPVLLLLPRVACGAGLVWSTSDRRCDWPTAGGCQEGSSGIRS